MRENRRSHRRGCGRRFIFRRLTRASVLLKPLKLNGAELRIELQLLQFRGTARTADSCLFSFRRSSRKNEFGEIVQRSEFEASAMKCPFCGFANDKVVDSRESKEADSIRRRRECLKCGKRFTTYERIDEIPYMVVKKDGRREKFDRQKVLNGLLRACEKRPVPISKLEQIVNESESFVMESAERERKTSELGELIMNRLRRYDKVAYVRFASVYLDFKDVKEFMNELKDLVKVKTP
jgi:transcriptional repressor NrdR